MHRWKGSNEEGRKKGRKEEKEEKEERGGAFQLDFALEKRPTVVLAAEHWIERSDLGTFAAALPLELPSQRGADHYLNCPGRRELTCPNPIGG